MIDSEQIWAEHIWSYIFCCSPEVQRDSKLGFQLPAFQKFTIWGSGFELNTVTQTLCLGRLSLFLSLISKTQP